MKEWYRIAKRSRWSDFVDLRRTYPHADQVVVASGEIATVFNIAGNNYRLVTAVHYRPQIVYTLLVLTHAEYSRSAWKNKL